MACNADHMEANEHERESRNVAGHIVALVTFMNKKGMPLAIPYEELKRLRDISKEYYGARDEVHTLTAKLCEMCGKHEEFIYMDARNKKMRELATWWEEHKDADAEKARKALVKNISESITIHLTSLDTIEAGALLLTNEYMTDMWYRLMDIIADHCEEKSIGKWEEAIGVAVKEAKEDGGFDDIFLVLYSAFIAKHGASASDMLLSIDIGNL